MLVFLSSMLSQDTQRLNWWKRCQFLLPSRYAITFDKTEDVRNRLHLLKQLYVAT